MNKVQEYKNNIREYSYSPTLVSYFVGLAIHDRDLSNVQVHDIASFARSLLPAGYLSGQLSLFL